MPHLPRLTSRRTGNFSLVEALLCLYLNDAFVLRVRLQYARVQNHLYHRTGWYFTRACRPQPLKQNNSYKTSELQERLRRAQSKPAHGAAESRAVTGSTSSDLAERFKRRKA